MNGEVELYKECLTRHQRQTGGGLGHYEDFHPLPMYGRRAQRGMGLWGDIFSKIGQIALPIAKRAGARALKEAVGLGQDILGGENAKTALKKRGKKFVVDTLRSEVGLNKQAQGRKRKTQRPNQGWISTKRTKTRL